MCQSLSFLIKLEAFLIEKVTLSQVFSCEFRENFKNTSFYKTPPVAASVGRES